ncbi:DUF1295 domain-containing protein [Methyloparacoccus murrellii]
MFDWNLAGQGLLLMLALATLTWLLSLRKRDVSIVDSVWSWFFLAALLLWWWTPLPTNGPRASLTLLLVSLWGLRLSGYLTWRNWGQPEDRRYQAIRARNQPHYAVKSLVIVFALQALLAWVIAWPILPAMKSPAALGGLDALGVALFLAGWCIESLADLQMARFRARPRGHDAVLDSGLWRYSRHPNYFGETLLWWGFYLVAVAAGAPLWIVVSPLLITFLLVKVSGVPLLEADIAERRPAYRDYIRNTSAFVPRPPGRTPS